MDISNVDSPYQQKSKSYFENRRAEMLRFIPDGIESVLEVGCGTGAFGALLKSMRQIYYVGIDLNPSSICVASERIDNAICMNLETEDLPKSYHFDCIVCNDVLEHMYNPWAVLKRLALALNPGGYIVASLPNIRYFPVFKDYIIHRQWLYKEDGVLDWTHVRFFTDKTAKSLFESSGFDIIEFQGINGSRFPWKFGLLNKCFFNRFNDMRWKQFACVGKLKA